MKLCSGAAPYWSWWSRARVYGAEQSQTPPKQGKRSITFVFGKKERIGNS
jgi:hypothetical protein